MSWPRGSYFQKINGERVRRSAFSVRAYDEKRDMLLVIDRPLNHETQRYEEIERWVPVEDVYYLNWEAHEKFDGVLKDRIKCLVTGYGADQKAEIATEQGYKLGH
jgi:hypothetical protein